MWHRRRDRTGNLLMSNPGSCRSRAARMNSSLPRRAVPSGDLTSCGIGAEDVDGEEVKQELVKAMKLAAPLRQTVSAGRHAALDALEICRRRNSVLADGTPMKIPGIYLTLLHSNEHEPLTHAHPHRQEHQGHLPGLYRQERHFPFRAGDRLRHQNGRRHFARAKAAPPISTCRCSIRWPRRAKKPAATPA